MRKKLGEMCGRESETVDTSRRRGKSEREGQGEALKIKCRVWM